MSQSRIPTGNINLPCSRKVIQHTSAPSTTLPRPRCLLGCNPHFNCSGFNPGNHPASAPTQFRGGNFREYRRCFRHPPLFLPVLVFAVYAVQLPLSPLVYLWADTVFQAPFTYSSPPVSATFYLLLPRFKPRLMSGCSHCHLIHLLLFIRPSLLYCAWAIRFSIWHLFLWRLEAVAISTFLS